MLLGVEAVIGTSLERIHRSNLIGMGALPSSSDPGESAEQLGLTGEEAYAVIGLEGADALPDEITVRAETDGRARDLTVTVRIDIPAEAAYFQHGGILPYVLRQLLQS